jgi:ABC-2 type transport system ATP-binding protein
MSSDHAPVLQLVDFGVRFPTYTFHPLTLSFAPGDRVALLGANGSGKTTMLAALAGQLPQHDGAVHADGVDVAPDRARHRARVGYLPDRPLGFPQTTVREHLALLARLFPTWDAAYAEALRERLALATDARLGTLSRGMGVKLAFVAAEAHRPPYLLLDEPTSGLDPLVRVELLTTVRELAAEDPRRVVLFSTHLLEDVELLAERVVALRDGRLSTDAPVATLRAAARGRSLPQVIRDEVLAA